MRENIHPKSLLAKKKNTQEKERRKEKFGSKISCSMPSTSPCAEKENTGKREKEGDIWEQKWQMVL